MPHKKPNLELILFRGFGGASQVCLAGRLQHVSHLVPDAPASGFMRRLRNAWRLMVSRRVPHTQIELSYGGEQWLAETDSHGYFFSCRACATEATTGQNWRQFHCRVLSECEEDRISATGDVLMATHSAERIIVSDIDDTIVHTGVANKLKMLWHLYFADGSKREPFPGMDALLRGLYCGESGHAKNPMLYVSRSPWSIYPMLDAFFNTHHIPTGPVLLLRDWGISWRHPLPRRAIDHKAIMIDRVLGAFPELPVVLLGDSGQSDPEVYADAAERHAGRIQAIYIRNLQISGSRNSELTDLAGRLESLGVPLIVSDDTYDMARDAIERGWINTTALAAEDRRRLFNPG